MLRAHFVQVAAAVIQLPLRRAKWIQLCPSLLSCCRTQMLQVLEMTLPHVKSLRT